MSVTRGNAGSACLWLPKLGVWAHRSPHLDCPNVIAPGLSPEEMEALVQDTVDKIMKGLM